ncbi:hypothetical protein VNO80_28866 [Phaseolus coccineus]|uniref:GDSL esterase/lipase n=1 Tax=Phaseolus coccineus TaxID=3886 RepID=A0AAN9QHY7_PHACN
MEMEAKTKPWLVLSLFLLAANCMQQCVHGKPRVSCFFIFGDSFSDNGNNNNRNTNAKSNYSPYGIDFSRGPTGRFTNGQTEADITAARLGFRNSVPPYANTSGSDIMGVNYASAAAGIRPETGSQRVLFMYHSFLICLSLSSISFWYDIEGFVFQCSRMPPTQGEIISLEEQIQNHRDIYNRLVKKLGGSNKAKKYLSKCLYYMRIGTNDYYGNYFLPQVFSTSRDFTTDQYAEDLVRRYSRYMKILHDVYEARKFLVFDLGRIGCTPYARATYARRRRCAEEVNDAALYFDRKLKSELEQLNSDKLSADAEFMFVNSTTKLDTDPTSLGFTVVDTPCCPTQLNLSCIENGRPCSNRDQYVYWDGIHQTQAANEITADITSDAITSLLRS